MEWGGDEIASVPCVSIANHPDEKKYQKKKGGGTNTHLRATDISVLAKGGLRKLIGRPLSRFKRKWQLDLAAGRRFDCGSKVGFVEATLALALEREDMGAEVRAMAERLLGH